MLISKHTPLAIRKVHGALLPLFVSLVCCCYLDRTSLAFAALQLCQEPWFSPKVYGLGSGAFYLGYVTAQVPSNLLLARWGPATWLPAITAAWGVASACCAALSGPTSFYLLRLALGVTEAGAFPGMWYVAGQFYPDAYITLPYSIIEASIAISQILAAPLAAALLQLGGLGGLEGWRWLFLVQGAATLVLAGVLRLRLPNGPATAPFLDEDERAWLLRELGHGGGAGGAGQHLVGCHGAAAGGGGGQQQQHGFPEADPLHPRQLQLAAVGQPGEAAAAAAEAGVVGSAAASGATSPTEDSEAVSLLAQSSSSWQAGAHPQHHHCHHHHPATHPAEDTLLPSHHQHHHQHPPDSSCGRDTPGWCPAAAAGSKHPQGHHTQQGDVHDGPAASCSAPVPPAGAWAQLRSVLSCRWLLYLMGLKALKDISLDALVYWVPTLVHALRDPAAVVSLSAGPSPPYSAPHPRSCGTPSSQLAAVLLSAIPFGTAAAAALLLGASSEARGERHWHIGAPLLAGGVAFLALPAALRWLGTAAAFACVVVAVIAADATTGPFWTWVHLAAPPGSGAVALAAVNSVGKAAGMLGPVSFGVMQEATHSYLPSILLVGGVLLGGGTLALAYRGPEARPGSSSSRSSRGDMCAADGAAARKPAGGGRPSSRAAAELSGSTTPRWWQRWGLRRWWRPHTSAAEEGWELARCSGARLGQGPQAEEQHPL